MGFKAWLSKGPQAMVRVGPESMTLYRDRVEFVPKGVGRKESAPLGGLEVALDEGSAVLSRVTITRLALIGVFAFGAKKTTGGEKYLTVVGPESFWVMEVPRGKVGEAHTFVVKFRELQAALAD